MANVALPAQILAANPNISAQVSANAGTGKTHVLTQRVLRLLLAEVQPSRIVCLTYTRTAAAEMSERISSRLQKWAVIDDAELAEELANLTGEKVEPEQMRLARQLFAGVLNAMPPPRIQTIHSFCQEVLKKFPLEAGITPYFSVIDDVTSKELIAEAKQRIVHKQDDESLVAALEFIAGNTSESWFNDMLREVTGGRNKFRAYFSGESRIQGFVDSDAVRAKVADYDAELMRILVREWTNRQTKTHDKQLAQWNEFLDGGDADVLLSLFLTGKMEPRKSLLNKAGMDANPELEGLILREQERILQVLDNWRTAEMMNLSYAVQQVSEAFIRIYDELKAAKNVLDYEDLIFYTNKLLASSNSAAWILYKLDGGIDHILIDEAQDASPEQWQIIQQITTEFFAGDGAKEEGRSLFIVGDEKQSIYSFQGAQPQILREVSGQYGKACIEGGKEWHKIPLSMSFRSLPTVLNFVDAVFNQPVIKQVDTFADEIAHDAHREGEGLVELWPLFEAEEYEAVGSWELPVKSYKAISHEVDLAEAIVKRIAGWLRSGRKLKAKDRAIEAGDIVILLRNRGKLANILVRKLKEAGIPVAGSDRLKLTEHIAIQDLVALAEFCLYPLDDLSLASLLKSPVFGMSEDDLFELAHGRGRGSLVDALEKNSKFNAVLSKLKALQELCAEVSPYEFYDYLLNNMGARAEFLKRMGEEVNDPLDEFLDLLLQYENNHSRSLQNFLQWFKTSDYEIKRDMEARGSEVRVMTAHAAKGLQAPIVFLPDTTSDISSSKNTSKLCWHEGKFFALQRSSMACEFLKTLIEQKKAAEYEEYLRLLYVALTRAEDELYICGKIGRGNDAKPESWYGVLQERMRVVGAQEDGVWRFGDAAFDFSTPTKSESEVRADLPEFLAEKVEVEASPTPKKRFAGEGFAAISRGIKIHKFFEHYDASRAGIAEALAQQYLRESDLVAEVLAVIAQPEFAEVFAKGSIAEASILTEEGIARLDRLVVQDGVAMIIDFKTGARNGASYGAQMKKYADAVQKIYPDKQVVTKILWTNELELEAVRLDKG